VVGGTALAGVEVADGALVVTSVDAGTVVSSPAVVG
jgi:hypothetical protein